MLPIPLLLLASPGLFQVAGFTALRDGRYDGTFDVARLSDHGDVGLGTFNALDGEMVVVDGKVYQIDGFGEARIAPPGTKTPFAFVTRFRADRKLRVDRPMSSQEVQTWIDLMAPQRDRTVAIRIEGRFDGLQARSFAPQQKPYLPFAKIVDRQSMLPYGEVVGSFVGFRMPPSVAPGNVPGFHFHFVTQDRKKGGHVLGFRLVKGTISVMKVGPTTVVANERTPA